MYIKSFTEYQYINESLVDITIEELIKIIFNQLDISYEYIKYLDRGSNGVAYDIGFNKILKITNHTEEAKTAAYINQNHNRYIATIFNIFQIETYKYRFPRIGLRFPYFDDIYFIIVEKLNTDISKDYNELLIKISDKFLLSSFKHNTYKIFTNKDVTNYIKTEHSNKYELFKKLQTYFSSIKINYAMTLIDAHAGNIGLDSGGNIKVFDVFDKKLKGEIPIYTI